MTLFRTHAQAFGLDVSDDVMRALQFTGQRRGLVVTAFAEQPLAAGIIVKGEPQEPKSLADAIKSMLTKPAFGRFSSRQVVVGLPDGRTFAKVVEAPSAGADQTQQSIQDEVSQFLPYPTEELYLDWKPFGASHGLDKIRVIVNAVPKVLADGYGAALEDADLKPIAFITEPSAIAYALTGETVPKEAARLIINLGQQQTTFLIVDHDAVTYSSTDYAVAGRLMTDRIATILQITPTEAAAAKLLCGLDPTRGRAALPTILQPFIEMLVNDIRRIGAYYAARSATGTAISETVLVGSDAAMPQLVNYLSAALGQKVVIGNPWAKTGNVKTNGLANRQRGLAWSAVIGLGLLALSSKITEA
jgi:type IV pilus assembly protein PilM